jgi:tRNA pseudouridine synthase 9
LEGPSTIPDWREPGEGEELIINNGFAVSRHENLADGDDAREDDVLALVRGVGMVNLSQKLRDGQDLTIE